MVFRIDSARRARSRSRGGDDVSRAAAWLKYLAASTVIFGAMILFGLLASIYYVVPGFLLKIFNFSRAKIVHIDASCAGC